MSANHAHLGASVAVEQVVLRTAHDLIGDDHVASGYRNPFAIAAKAREPDPPYFAPRAGVPEDPVTGSAHCVLAPFWAERLGKPDFLAYQASPRGGTLKVRLAGDRVKLGGQAVTVLRGELL